MTNKRKSDLLSTAAFLVALAPAGLVSSMALAQTPPGCGASFDEVNAFVTVTCETGQVDSEFSFFERNMDFLQEEEYDGEGNDILNMDGGSLINAPGTIPPESIPPGLPFNPTDGAFDFLGGNDAVYMNSGSIGSEAAPATLFLGNGADTFDMKGGTVYADINGENGNDIFILTGGTLTGALNGGAGNDAFTVDGGTLNGTIDGGSGTNSLTMKSGRINGNVSLGNVGHVLVSGGTIDGDIYGTRGDGGSRPLQYALIEGGTITGDVYTQDASFLDGTIEGRLIASGAVGIEDGSIAGGVSAMNLTMTGGAIGGSIYGMTNTDSTVDPDNPVVTNSNTFNISGGSIGTEAERAEIFLQDGDDAFNMTGGTVFSSIDGGDGNDAFAFSGGTVTGNINGGTGNNTFTVAGGTVNGNIGGSGGVNSFAMTSGAVNGNVSVNDAQIGGGTVDGNVTAASVTIHGGAVEGNIGNGESPTGNFWMTSGSVGGNIDASSFDIDGGSVGGNVSGLTTLLMHENYDHEGVSAPIQFRDGVTFSGTNATGYLEGTRFTDRSQNFTGFSTLTLNDSVIGFGGDQGIDSIIANNGSVIRTTGNFSLLDQAGTGLGTLALDRSSLSMYNGIAGDSFTVGALTMNDSSILIDYDQDGGAIDSLVVTPGGASTITGDNLIRVNILGTPVLDRESDIAVIQTGSAIDPALFRVEGIDGTLSSLYNYEMIGDPAGGLTLRASPVGTTGDPLSPVNTTILSTSLNQLNDITDANIADAFGLTTASGGGAAAAGNGGIPFGIFSTGQLARSHYDGFRVVGTGQSTPNYSSTEMSMAASLDWNASEYFGFDQQYGLNIGVFGGYASSDVDLGSFLSFASAGSAINRSGLFGGYTLFRKERSYLVFSAIGLLGNTDVTNGLLNNSTGSYNTQGAAVTLSAGHIFSLTDTVRFDLRGGVLAARFTGDDFTDSIGVKYGKSEVSFGGLKFEPGIYMDHKLDNGMSISPYLRAEFQQLLGYKNKSGIGGVNYEFDTATFSAALSGGANLQINPTTTLSSEVKVKASADSRSIAGKLGIKFAF